ncbi:ABC transporter permease [Azonexus sp.]|uniref:ABC transporter permease n=1 Tax=Azonexus sp. TaxID=1872668 RepID=UPI0039E47D69
MNWRLAWRMLGREWRAGELRLIFAALLLAVAAVTAVGFLSDRLQRALQGEAAQLLGADLILTADQPLAPEFAAEAQKRGLRTAQIQLFPSMVFANGRTQLVEIKAVDEAYPLRGSLQVAQNPEAEMQGATQGPAAGEAWVDARLFQQLALHSGAMLGVGRLQLPVARVLLRESDRAFNFFSLSPRVMIALEAVPESGLTAFGARVTYRLQLAGEAAALENWRAWAAPRLGRGQRLEGVQDAQPEVRKALDQAGRFLGLASLLTVLLAAIAVALAARRYLARHLDTCALLRCFGMTQKQVLRLHLAAFFLLALGAAICGILLGFIVHLALVSGLASLFAIPLPPPGGHALGQGALVAFVLLFGFVLPPILQLAQVPTVRVLRREFGPPAGQAILAYAVGGCLLVALVLLTAGELRLGAMAVAGFLAVALCFAASAGGLLSLLLRLLRQGKLAQGFGFSLRYGALSLARHRLANVFNVVALGSGMMALLLLGVTRLELIDTWQQRLPADAPNRFIINIQPPQRAAVAAALRSLGIEAELSPMVRARLTAKNGKAVSAADFPADERAQRLVEREFNLSWRDSLPAGNRLSAGAWFAGPGAFASVEEGLAKSLGIALGDRLEFSVAGLQKTLTVTNLRKLDWDSMRVNFFVLAPSGVLEDAPASFITSFHLPTRDGHDPLAALVAQFPNLTVIDIASLLAQIQAVLGQIVGVVQLVFLFTLAAGVVVLYAALLAVVDARRQEIAVLRALGAQRAQLRRAVLIELASLGALAGGLAALGAALLGQLLAYQVFATAADTSWLTLFFSAALAALGVAAAGWLSVRRLLDTPAVDALRA